MSAPYHAHIYFTDSDRPAAQLLYENFSAHPAILFVGRMMNHGVGPHPMPQYEVHFLEDARPAVVSAITASGLRALVHPLTDDDLADHTTQAEWIGEPLALDESTLDPPGHNQGIPRFGKSDF